MSFSYLAAVAHKGTYLRKPGLYKPGALSPDGRPRPS